MMNTIKSLTPEQLKEDDNLLSYLETEHMPPVMLFLIYAGGSHIDYYLFAERNLIAQGGDFKPGRGMEQDSIECMISLLSFLTLRPGDVDKEFFATHTPEHLKWLDSTTVDELRMWISDFEDQDSEEHQYAVEYFERYFHA